MIPLIPFLLALACSDSRIGKGTADMDEDNADDTGSDPTDTGDDGGVVPTWWTLSARVEVRDAAPALDGVEVRLQVLDGNSTDTLCETTLDTTEVLAGVPPDDTIGWWWELDVQPDDGCDDVAAALPTHLGVGIGELVPDVRARLGSVALDPVADSLYGAYVQADADTVYTFGWAGTDADIAGDDIAQQPPPDGQYRVEPLFLLALSSE